MSGIRLSAAEAAKVLDRYGDVLSQFTVLPFLMHLKFGDVVQRMRKLDAKEGEEQEGSSFVANLLPNPTVVLLLLAELSSSLAMLDPQDKLVQRAAGQFFRKYKAVMKGGQSFGFETFSQIMAEEDVFTVFKYLAMVAGLSGTLLAVWWNSASDGSEATAGFNPAAIIRRIAAIMRQTGKAMRSSVNFLIFVLVASVIMGNFSELQKLAKAQAIREVLEVASRLFRALALVVAAFGSSSTSEGTFKAWVISQAALSYARACRLFIYERLSMSALIDLEQGGRDLVLARGALMMEAICGLALLPYICRNRRTALATLVLLVPPGLLAQGHAGGGPKESYILKHMADPQTPHRLVLTVAALSAATLFLGG
eukprot:CAMPEP_0178383264 /NCGR_PEP_ID=MMETSP0689_2-20121128/6913_1 /TAXON_ID=160604 /ORGANISM="Amphidinium massartii, Strain CS-259" /LENGTH=367 /DNA_ID=CAMNT_0020003481 /DNA_START=202 /DNA_END=1301 /DNA_ORIENTATION=-